LPDINETVERKAINREQDFGGVGSMTSAKEGRKGGRRLPVPSMKYYGAQRY
jgi:hypothetical protein